MSEREGLLGRLCRDDAGQDLVEYALLLALFGVAIMATWDTIVQAVRSSYTGANTRVPPLWNTPDPGR